MPAAAKGKRWGIKVVWLDGTEDVLSERRRPATFPSRKKAEEWRDFMLQGMADEVQSINVVEML